MFRVIYYRNRVSIEFFHVLTDGTGGMLFLKSLINEYIRLLGHEVSYSESVLDINVKPNVEDSENKFENIECGEKASGFKNSAALQFNGSTEKMKPIKVVHLYMNSSELKEIVKTKKVTVTSYILSLILLAGKGDSKISKGEYNIQVPVNLRSYYPSSTQRNFALYCQIRLAASKITTVDHMLPEITYQLKTKTSIDQMNAMITSTRNMVRNMYYMPLIIKNYGGRFGYSYLGDRGFSGLFSNLGVVKVPEKLEKHIRNFEFMLGPGISNRNECAMVTFGDTSVLSITKITRDSSFEEKFVELLSRDGLSVKVLGSEDYGNKLS